LPAALIGVSIWATCAITSPIFYSPIGRPSIDPELMIRMLIVGYC
jgi:hypothetical protein